VQSREHKPVQIMRINAEKTQRFVLVKLGKILSINALQIVSINSKKTQRLAGVNLAKIVSSKLCKS
jgi:hypothetical protein